MKFKELFESLFIVSNFLNEDNENKIYKINTNLRKREDRDDLINCIKELAELDSESDRHLEIQRRTMPDDVMVNVSNLQEVKNFLKNFSSRYVQSIRCDDNKSYGAVGKVFIFKINQQNAKQLGYEQKNGLYLKVQFKKKTQSKNSRVGLTDHNGFININTLEVKVNFMSFHESCIH